MSPKKKSPNKKQSKSDVPLPLDALALVADFLAPRDLYRLMTSTCKGLRDRLTISQVVKSALCHGGWPQTTVERLYPLMEHRQIHPVSALRLLRLVNVRRCECCNITRVQTVHEHYGVAFCRRRCLDPSEIEFYGGGMPFLVNAVDGPPTFEHLSWRRLVCAYREDDNGMFFRGWTRRKPFLQNGTPCGPVFTVGEVKAAYFGGDPQTREERLAALLAQLPPDPEGTYNEFVKTYKEIHEKAKKRRAEREATLKRKRLERQKKQAARLRRELER